MRPEPAPARTEAAVAVADLYRAHYRSVLRICRRYLRNDHEAEDAAQETFLAAHKSLLGGSAPEQPLAWLVAIARNTCWQRSQRLVRQPLALVEPEEQADERDALAGAVQADRRNKLWEAVGDLPQRQQNAFVLCEVEGQSYVEAAARLAITEPALEALLVRARRRLRQRLQPLAGSLQAAIALPSTLLNRFGLGADGGTVAGAAKAGTGAVAVKAAAATLGLVVIGGGTLVAHTGFRHTAPQEAIASIPRSAALHAKTGRPAVSREQTEQAAIVALHGPVRGEERRHRRTAGFESGHNADGRGQLEPDDPTGAGRTSTPALQPATADDGGDPSASSTPAATVGDPPSSSSDPATAPAAPSDSSNDSQPTDTASASALAPVDPTGPSNDAQSTDTTSSPDAPPAAPDDSASAN